MFTSSSSVEGFALRCVAGKTLGVDRGTARAAFGGRTLTAFGDIKGLGATGGGDLGILVGSG